MRRKTANSHKPTLSNYQKVQRRAAIQIIVVFALVAMAIGFGFYWYEKANLRP